MADGAQAEPWNHSPRTVPGTAPGKIGVEVFAGREGVCQPPAGGQVASDGGPRPAQVFPRSPDKAAPKILFGHPCAQPGGQGAQGGAGAWGWAGLAGQGLRPQYKAPRAGRAFAQVRGARLASSGGKAGSGGHLSSRTMPGPWLLLLFCGGTLLSGEWGLRATLRGGRRPLHGGTSLHSARGGRPRGGWQIAGHSPLWPGCTCQGPAGPARGTEATGAKAGDAVGRGPRDMQAPQQQACQGHFGATALGSALSQAPPPAHWAQRSPGAARGRVGPVGARCREPGADLAPGS